MDWFQVMDHCRERDCDVKVRLATWTGCSLHSSKFLRGTLGSFISLKFSFDHSALNGQRMTVVRRSYLCQPLNLVMSNEDPSTFGIDSEGHNSACLAKAQTNSFHNPLRLTIDRGDWSQPSFAYKVHNCVCLSIGRRRRRALGHFA